MALFGLFGKIPPKGADWPAVAGQLSGMLWHLLATEPKILASPYARVVLRKDWTVFIASDKRDPKYILGWGDVSFVFFQEEQAALAKWVEGLKSIPYPRFQQIETEEFAKALVRALMKTVEVVE